jgi:hypothetical protein
VVAQEGRGAASSTGSADMLTVSAMCIQIAQLYRTEVTLERPLISGAAAG